MRILVLGGGGREHALCWAIARSPRLTKLWCAPGNPGIAGVATCVLLDPADPAAMVAFAGMERVDLVVVGPEAPLAAGVVDALEAAGVPTFGPTRAAAQVEASKGFTKDLCARAGVPTAAYRRFTERDAALRHAAAHPLPVVVKADGLAAGKGVTVAESHEEAAAAIEAIFDNPGGTCVIEAFLDGEEASLFVLTDGTTALPFGSAQDHKRVGDGDAGPNTGGMGAYSPASVLTPALQARAMAEIVEPTLGELRAAGTPYRGVLYAGLMLTADGPQLIEYNARFGDPEAQVLMTRLESDIVPLLHACATGRLAEAEPPRWSDEPALTVVLAAAGYPGTPARGGTIEGIEAAEADGAVVFHAGTTRGPDGTLIASGGRVLAVTATGANVAAAQARAYGAIEKISWADGFCRRDIGWREIARERGE